MQDSQSKSRVVMDATAVRGAIDRLISEILKRMDAADLAIVGIQTGGVLVAKRLLRGLERRLGIRIPFGVLDISLYRDDTMLSRQQPEVRETRIPFRVSGANILLVDDVIYTGRTIRAALDALIDFGRPRAIRLAVLVDRGLREYPIQPDFVGVRLRTTPEETVRVQISDRPAPDDKVVVIRKET